MDANALAWRTHSCVPRRQSCRRMALCKLERAGAKPRWSTVYREPEAEEQRDPASIPRASLSCNHRPSAHRRRPWKTCLFAWWAPTLPKRWTGCEGSGYRGARAAESYHVSFALIPGCWPTFSGSIGRREVRLPRTRCLRGLLVRRGFRTVTASTSRPLLHYLDDVALVHRALKPTRSTCAPRR